MKKIIAAFDGLKYSEETRKYALYLAKLTQAHLAGVFMDDFTYTSYKIYELITSDGVSESRIKKLQHKDQLIRDGAVRNFEEACRKEGLEYNVHRDRNIAIQELLHESIYADLLVIDSKETLTHYAEKPPTRFIRQLLTDVQCPVFLGPQSYTPIGKVILLYDGEPSSVHAIKMFSYLLPQLQEFETEVISVNPVDGSMHLPDNRLMKEFMQRHYPAAKYTVLKGVANVEIIKYLKKKQNANALVVLGAYRRNQVSRWFRESMADLLMRSTDLPLFVAHNK